MLIKNFILYLNERFPVINMALFAILFLTVYSVASYFPEAALSFEYDILFGILATISFFFRLRVFDEIKDYQIDAVNHPQRVLQSGKVKLRHLIIISLAGLAFEACWSWMMGPLTFLAWLGVVCYSLLMRYEFFIGHYLQKKLILYAFTHMLIMPLIILWIWSAYNPEVISSLTFLLLALLSLLGGFSFEIARKIKAPDDEKPLIDSYSKELGFRQSILSVLAILLMGSMVQLYLLYQIGSKSWPFFLIIMLYVGTTSVYVSGILKPRTKTLKMAEIFVSLFMLISYLTIIIEVNF